MWKFPLFLFLCASSALTQTTGNRFDKAPRNVDDALRARVKEFYQDHVDGKFRKAELLVAEESKDGFYAANKPALEAFRLGDVAYSDGYKAAKVTIVGKMTMNFFGMGAPQVMDVPFPSFWKVEQGKWCWYINNDPNRITPFGKINPQTTSQSKADPGTAFQMPDVKTILEGVGADRTAVKLAQSEGAEEQVKIANRLPGAVKLQIEKAAYPGLEVKLDRADLRGGETAVLTVRAASKSFSAQTVRILVQPMNQAIDIVISF